MLCSSLGSRNGGRLMRRYGATRGRCSGFTRCLCQPKSILAETESFENAYGNKLNSSVLQILIMRA
jgi:hypothetical protein